MKNIKLTEKEIFFWTKTAVLAEPHEEYIPWLCLFRPLTSNNALWVFTWPELTI